MAEQQIDPRLVDQARQEINRLIGEIEQLAAQDLEANDFYVEFLRRVMSALAAPASALWVKTQQGNLQAVYQVGLPEILPPGADTVRQAHDELLRRVILQGTPAIVPPSSGPTEQPELGQPSNPTKFLIVLAPILLEGTAVGLVEVFLAPDRRAAAQSGFVRFLTRVAEEAAKFLKNRQFRHLRGQEQLWNDLETYIRSVHGGLNPKQVSYLIANDGRKLIRCERVSVAIRRGSKTVVEAISGQETVEKRSNLVRLLGKLAERVILHGENLVYRGHVEEHWPKDIVHSLERYREECPSKLIVVVPMPDQREFGKTEKPTTALVVEMVEDDANPEEMAGRTEVVARHGSIALYNALEHHQVFMLPVWKAVGNRTKWFNAYTMPKIYLAIGLLIGTILFMAIFPWPLRLEGRGALVPKERRIVYAPITGRVQTVRVDFKDSVDPGTVLTEMHDPMLEQDMLKVEGDLRTAELTLRNQMSARDRVKAEEEPKALAEVTETTIKINSLRLQQRELEVRKRDLMVTSPIRGQVMDWKPKETLTQRPVQQGDRMLEVAETDGEWILEVKLPENTITHIARARQKRGEALPVTFVVSSAPDTAYHGTLLEVSTQATTEEQENFVLAKIKLDPNEDVPKVIGTSGVEVRAKVDCGPHAVGYVLFRELIDFVREYVFF